jgi:hypothetical protein
MDRKAFKDQKRFFETKTPSPDRSENHFVPGFGTKDWLRQLFGNPEQLNFHAV